MRTYAFALSSAMLVACGSEPGPVEPDATVDAAAECEGSCVESTWWLAASSTCQVLCSGNPSLAECAQSDCESLEARRYEAGTRLVLAPALHSATSRSFYVFTAPTSETYSIEAGCLLRQGSTTPREFTCSPSTLTFPTGAFSAADPAEAGALDAAAQAGVEGRYAY